MHLNPKLAVNLSRLFSNAISVVLFYPFVLEKVRVAKLWTFPYRTLKESSDGPRRRVDGGEVCECGISDDNRVERRWWLLSPHWLWTRGLRKSTQSTDAHLIASVAPRHTRFNVSLNGHRLGAALLVLFLNRVVEMIIALLHSPPSLSICGAFLYLNILM